MEIEISKPVVEMGNLVTACTTITVSAKELPGWVPDSIVLEAVRQVFLHGTGAVCEIDGPHTVSVWWTWNLDTAGTEEAVRRLSGIEGAATRISDVLTHVMERFRKHHVALTGREPGSR